MTAMVVVVATALVVLVVDKVSVLWAQRIFFGAVPVVTTGQRYPYLTGGTPC